MVRTMLTLGLLLFVTLLATAFAVSCYECDSVNDSNCGDEFQSDDIAKTDCDSIEPDDQHAIYIQRPETACLTKYYKGLPGEALFVRRSCAFGDLTECDEEPDAEVPHYNFLGCVFCHKDLCNRSMDNKALNLSSLMSLIFICLILINN